MRRQSGYLVGLGAALAVSSFLIGLEVSSTTAASSVGEPALTVNRTLKSDRMPAKSRNAVNGPLEIKSPPTAKPVLLEGCEPIVSTIGQPPLAKVAGRCVS
jgi:hypothetical protein